MSQLAPCKRSEFIRRLGRLGFDGPYSGSKHQFLVLGNSRLTVPSNSEYSVPQLKMMLREAGDILGSNIEANEWNKLK